MLTIIIPVKNPIDLEIFIRRNRWAFEKYQVIVIDSGGGERLAKYATIYVKKDVCLTDARKLGYKLAKTKYILNLDSDVIIPRGYIQTSLLLLEGYADAVSIFFEDIAHCQGALEFGISIWKTEILKNLYDFTFDLISDKIVQIAPQKYSGLHHGWCECNYMWRKLKKNGRKLETLPFRAIHLKDKN